MPKIKIDDLAKIKEKHLTATTLRTGGPYRVKLNVHMGTCGIAAGAREIVATFMKLIESKDVKDVLLTTSGCAGLCSMEPMITIEVEGAAPVKYGELNADRAKRIFQEHVLDGKIVKDFAIAKGHERQA
ncbi:MAG: NADP oxidoreductase [Candidatus Fischerbacteria bacterium RBG_13_37_8]|uniref:NADP oxidoreductase n=1 Tax=Candidatus Fischerbacteria bacterium RBG_13_37_8 TaxID=1817863 RepID=A0A1F5V8C1_9BACT|nr:MAG: NADP oxidoreductase [Candidatus Fischerbacteria bacterium RBG_13_37_8]